MERRWWCDVVRCLDVKPCKVKKNGFRFAKMFCDVFSCHLCDGSRTDLALQLHVSALEIKQAEQMIEAIQNTPAQFRSGSPYDSWRQAEQINDTRISEYRPD